ncbi:MAG: RNase J family beta-CASP ribonuclease [Candidatus Pacebacteria bacterium]|nr:RNase J family beta-CASP ribonuclease [Candidatus Paceibacterota bacterium]
MSKLQLVPLGGMGNVTQNMFLYQYENEILIVDCGIGFPDMYMPGADIIIPDISYLLKQVEAGKKIVGMVLSHGHDDHMAALPYLLPDLPDFPIYGSALTAGFAQQRMKDGKIRKKVEVMADLEPVQIGKHFTVTPFAVTHSVPDTKHLLIHTPEGKIYHGTDYKLDANPVDGVLTDYDAITQAGKEGVMLMLLDCLRVEKSEWTRSESTVGPAIEQEIHNTKGKFIVTLMSSHLHRIQQVVDIAVKYNRKIVFIGRSVEQNVRVALELGKLNIPAKAKINKRNIDQYRSDELVVVIAGSQGQEGSSLVRAVYGEHRAVRIEPQDKVVFSADAIPGNEVPYFQAIDELSRNRIDVVYPDISPNVHQSGHASAPEQQELVSLVKPSFLMPIGGADRHRELFRRRVAHKLGYSDHQTLLPETGEIIAIENNNWKIDGQINLKPRIVDGLGIGDVGPVVLSDRRALSEAGIVMVMIPRIKDHFDLKNIEVVSRGFVFMKQADEVISFIQEEAAKVIQSAGNKISDYDLKKKVESQLRRKLYKIIQREPIVMTVIVDV